MSSTFGRNTRLLQVIGLNIIFINQLRLVHRESKGSKFKDVDCGVSDRFDSLITTLFHIYIYSPRNYSEASNMAFILFLLQYLYSRKFI